jgi:hypothetical protein
MQETLKSRDLKSGFYCSKLILGKLAFSDFRVVQVLDGGIKFLQNVGNCLSIYRLFYPRRYDWVFIKNIFALDSVSGYCLLNCKTEYSPNYKRNSRCSSM